MPRAHRGWWPRASSGHRTERTLRLAGCELPLFETPAVEAIFQAASGLPRRANALAHHALFAAAIQKAKSINTEHVQAAMQEVS